MVAGVDVNMIKLIFLHDGNQPAGSDADIHLFCQTNIKQTVMNTRKIIAVIVAMLVILFPFKRAFLTDNEPGLMMIASFILTVVGIVVFYMLTLTRNTAGNR